MQTIQLLKFFIEDLLMSHNTSVKIDYSVYNRNPVPLPGARSILYWSNMDIKHGPSPVKIQWVRQRVKLHVLGSCLFEELFSGPTDIPLVIDPLRAHLLFFHICFIFHLDSFVSS